MLEPPEASICAPRALSARELLPALSALESSFFAISPPLDLGSPRNSRVAVASSCEGPARVRFAIGAPAAARQRGRKVASTSSPVAPPIAAAILKNTQSRQRSAGFLTRTQKVLRTARSQSTSSPIASPFTAPAIFNKKYRMLQQSSPITSRVISCIIVEPAVRPI